MLEFRLAFHRDEPVFALLAALLLLTLCIGGTLALIALVRHLTSRPPMTDDTTTADRSTTSSSFAERFAPHRRVDALSLRVATVAALALGLLIPLGLTGGIVAERGERYASVLHDIARTWGAEQTLLGPVMTVPYTTLETRKERVTDMNGVSRTVDRTVRHRRVARFLPDELSIDVTLDDTFRHRGLYRALVYGATIDLTATFPAIDIDAISTDVEKVHWDAARVAIGLSDTRAIDSVSTLTWNGAPGTLSPGTGIDELGPGFSAALPTLSDSGTHRLELSLAANGSGAFAFTPFGETTRVALRSRWPHPSFLGDALPDTHDIDADGFSARWEIPHLARNYPQRWSDADADPTDGGAHRLDLREFTAGVSLFEPVSLYSQITRSVKYGVLFIGLTFVTLLAFEVSIGRRLHLVQYALIGLSLCLFYLLVLSLSEHVGFVRAYAAGSAVTIVMIAGYVRAALASSGRALAVAGLLCALYAILYTLLQLEEFALLMGTALLVGLMGVLMLGTRRLRGSTRQVETTIARPAGTPA